VPLFLWAELLFSLPAILYALYRLAGRAGTTGALELLLLVYAFETAFTAAVCINDVGYWDPAAYPPRLKNVFRYQLYGPWFAVPALMFADMYSRLLRRLSAADAVKKTQ